ncbi:hypothetical protein SS05631_c30190 [Sinorhizobium sp. CCBAU 05631]|nr:hypothetical protein SS05631_c30190 [Sinorhizobium sp. CCBAU 05631]
MEAERRRRVCEEGYPEVNRLHERPDSADPRFAALADLCEPVRVDSEPYRQWRQHHEAVGWPFIPDPGFVPVVFSRGAGAKPWRNSGQRRWRL